MAMRVTGMMSGLDTETLISELVAAKQTKVDDLKKEQVRHEWKQEAWKGLNTKIYDLFKGTMDKLCYQSSYMKKTTIYKILTIPRNRLNESIRFRFHQFGNFCNRTSFSLATPIQEIIGFLGCRYPKFEAIICLFSFE